MAFHRPSAGAIVYFIDFSGEPALDGELLALPDKLPIGTPSDRVAAPGLNRVGSLASSTPPKHQKDLRSSLDYDSIRSPKERAELLRRVFQSPRRVSGEMELMVCYFKGIEHAHKND